MPKQMKNSLSTPLIVCNGVNATHRHHKSKEVYLANGENKNKPNQQKSYKHIYSKPITISSRASNGTNKKRKKGRGFPSQAQAQQFKNKKLISGSNASFSNMKKKTSTSRFSPAALVAPNMGKKTTKGVAFPSYQNINEGNFKN